MAKKKDTSIAEDAKKVWDDVWAWIRWPYDVVKSWRDNSKRWVVNTPVWKRLEAMEYDPPPFPLTWWMTRGSLILIILLTTHYWMYQEGRSASAFAAPMLFSQPTEMPNMSEVNYLRRLAAERTKSMNHWKRIATRLEDDNRALSMRVQELRRELSGSIDTSYKAIPPKKKVVKKYKPKPKKKPAPAKPSAWLSF